VATNTGSPYFIPFPEDNDPVDVAGDFETLARHLNDNLEEYVSDTVGLLVTSNTENGIVVTVDEATNKINFDVNDPVISLSGDVSGSATMTNLSNTDIAVTIQPNSVELGVDTYGPYVATITGTENQIDVLGSGTEDSDVILSLPQDIDIEAEPTFAGATLGEIQVGITDDNEIDTANGNLTIDSEGGTVVIDDNVDVSGNLAAPTLDLDLTTAPSYLEGRVFYDTETNVIAVYDNVTDNVIGMNQNVFIFGENSTGSTINKGSVVSCGGFDTDSTPLLVLASNDDSGRMPAIGVTNESIAPGARGKVFLHGKVDGLNTVGFGLGATLFVGTEGAFTEDRPVGDEALFQVVGRVGKIDATDGCILVAVDPVADLVPNLPNKHVWVGNEDAHAVATTDPNVNSLTLDADLAVNGGDITTTAETTSIFNTNALTVNFAGDATDIQIGSDSGTTNVNNDLDVDGDALFNQDVEIDGDLVVDGSLTVNGETTIVNSTIINIDDPVFTLGGDVLPTADDNKDRGIEFYWHNGTSAKAGFFGFDDSSGRFTFIPDATNTSEVFSGTLGDVEIGTLYTVGDVVISGQELNSTTTTFNLINNTATTINFGGAGTDIQIGSSTGTTNINNNLDVDGDVNIDGGDLTASTSTFNLLHTPTTINFGAAATDIQIGSSSGTTNINNDLDVDGDLNVDGGDLTVSTSVFNLANTTATTVNFAGAATDIQIGSASGITNINNDADIDGNLNVDGGSITSNLTNFNLLKTNVTTLDFAQAATNITIGATTGTTTIRNDVSVNGNVTINPDSVGPALVIGANAMNQLISGLNADLLDGQTGTWYQSRDNHTGTQLHDTISDWDEATQDVVGAMFDHELHSNLIAEYNDVTGQVVLTAPGIGSGFGDTAGVTLAQMYWFGV
jgi:hypothetical protein